MDIHLTRDAWAPRRRAIFAPRIEADRGTGIEAFALRRIIMVIRRDYADP